MAVAALRPDRAARPLRRREFRAAAQALSQLSLRLGVPQREAGPRPLPPVHAVRRRHGRRRLARRRCRDVHDGRRHAGGARHPARPVRDQGQLAEGARRRDGGDRARRRGERRPHGSRCCAPSTSSTGLGIEGVRQLLGPGRKDESGDFTKGAGLGEAQIRASETRSTGSMARSSNCRDRERATPSLANGPDGT